MLGKFQKNETQYLVLSTLQSVLRVVRGEAPGEIFNVAYGQMPNHDTKEMCSGYWLNYRGLSAFYSKLGTVYTFETSYAGMAEYLPNKKDVETQAEQQSTLKAIYDQLAERYRNDVSLYTKSTQPSISLDGIKIDFGKDDKTSS